MGYTFDIEPRDGVLWVRAPRVIDPDSVPGDPEFFEKLHAECTANACKGILLDARGVDLRIAWADKLRVALALARAQVRGHPVAALADPHNVDPGSGVPGVAQLAVVARLAGGTLCVFTDEEKALAWLDRRTTPTPSDGTDAGR